MSMSKSTTTMKISEMNSVQLLREILRLKIIVHSTMELLVVLI